MNDVYILGIESSCDETSISIVKNGKEEKKYIKQCAMSNS